MRIVCSVESLYRSGLELDESGRATTTDGKGLLVGMVGRCLLRHSARPSLDAVGVRTRTVWCYEHTCQEYALEAYRQHVSLFQLTSIEETDYAKTDDWDDVHTEDALLEKSTVLKHETVHKVVVDKTCSTRSKRAPDRRNLLTS